MRNIAKTTDTDLTIIEPEEDSELPPPATTEGMSLPSEVKMSEKEAQLAIKKSGLVGVRARSLSGFAGLGKFAAQQGMFNVGAGWLVGTFGQIQKLYNECCRHAKAVEKGSEFDGKYEVLVRLNELKDSLLAKQLQAAQSALKAGEAEPHGNQNRPSVIPFPPNVAVQINTTSSEVKVNTKPKP